MISTSGYSASGYSRSGLSLDRGPALADFVQRASSDLKADLGLAAFAPEADRECQVLDLNRVDPGVALADLEVGHDRIHGVNPDTDQEIMS